MTHECTNCSWIDFNNKFGPVDCPSCGGQLIHTWDEQGDHTDGDCTFYRDFDAEEICDTTEAEHALGIGDGEQDD